MRVVVLGLALAVLFARPAGAGRMLYATAATPGRIDGFCLDDNGSIAPTPSFRMETTGDQPRRLVVVGDVLYVAEVDRVEAFRIGQKGGLSALGRIEPLERMGPRDVAITSARTMLYVPDRSRGRVVGYPLDADGRPAREFTTCVQGPIGISYQNLLATEDKLYVSSSGGTGRIEVFGIAADGSLTGDDLVSLTPAACVSDNVERPAATTPLSERRRLNNIKTFVLVGDLLYAEDRGRRRIRAFRLTNGNFDPPIVETGRRKQWQRAESKTNSTVQYQALVYYRSALIGTQFFHGRIDSWRLEADGSLPKRPKRISTEDLRYTPVRLIADGDVVYVAAGEFDRIIAYRLRSSNGVLASADPFSQTDEQGGSFPNDVAIAMLPAGCGS